MDNDNSLRHVRPATLADLSDMLRMYEHSRSIMRAHGNTTQWVNGYPNEALLRNDISHGVSYIIEEVTADSTKLIGCFAFIVGNDPTYRIIEEGCWQDNEVPYGTIHRLACAPDCHGVAQACLDFCDRHAPSLRLDTHADNLIIQHIATRADFSYCGIIYVSDGTSRRAYQRMLPKNLLEPLQQYVEECILPRYDHYDEAHQQEHIRAVITRSLAMTERYKANRNMLYTAAAYHDLGMCEGRETHHLTSARILRDDKQLQEWFSPQQIAIMAEAVEDHRASSHSTPRQLYGCILAEADHILDCTEVVARTIQYSIAHYPHFTKEQHWQRTLEHLQEKYSRTGYLKLLLPDSINQEAQQQQHTLIDDEEQLFHHFSTIFDNNICK